MKLNLHQQAIVKSLLDTPPLTKGNYLVLTTNELYRMTPAEFIALCKKIIPEQTDLIAGFAFHPEEGSYLGRMIRKSLIQQIQRTYVTLSIKELKENYPSFFTHFDK